MEAWAFSETGIWRFSNLRSNWRFHLSLRVSHARYLHISEHDSVDLGSRLILGTSAAGTRYR